jgi:hypothetical protein
MAVNFNNFAPGTSLAETDQIVGFANTSAGGERKWTLSSLRTSLFSGAVSTIASTNLTASMALVSDASGKIATSSNVSSTELEYLDGVTSSIQTQLNAKQATITGAATSITASNLTPSVVLVSDSNGKVASSTVTVTELLNILTSSNNFVPTGMVMYYCRSTAPTGWMSCDGTAITTAMGASYTNLRNFLISAGNPFGSSGSDPLIPDLRGRFIRSNGSDGTYTSGTFGAKQSDDFKSHSHSGTATTAGAHSHSGTATTAGAHTHSLTIDSGGAHGHTGTAASAGDHTHTLSIAVRGGAGPGANYFSGACSGTNNDRNLSSSGSTAATAGAHTHSLTIDSGGAHGHTGTAASAGDHSHSISITSAGDHSHTVSITSTGGTETRPANIALLACIKL